MIFIFTQEQQNNIKITFLVSRLQDILQYIMAIQQNIEQQPPNYPKFRHASHTFSHSPSFFQIIAYICVSAQIIVYFICLYYLYENKIILCLYCLSGILMIIFTGICSLTNPTDRTIYKYKWSKHNKNIKFTTDYSQTCYCQFCDSFCAMKSKHCKLCNRCTANFDHHCIWINNCVGSANYRSFIAMIIITFCHLAVFIVAGAVMSAQTNIKQPQNLKYAIGVWVMMGILSIIQILLIQLIILHIYLLCRGITTYDLLQQKRRQQLFQKQDQITKRQVKQQKINQSQNSNATIKITQTNKIQIKESVEQNEQNKNSNMKKIDNKLYLEQKKQQQQEKQQMPSFIKKNKSLKIVFGSSQVQAPSHSRKKFQRFQ